MNEPQQRLGPTTLAALPAAMVHLHKTVWSPDELGAQIGDVVHVRNAHLYGRLIRRCLGSWGDHDGTLVHVTAERRRAFRLDFQGWGVAEAAPPRFRITPWREYFRALEARQKRLVFLRVPAPALVRFDVEDLAYTYTGRRYDKLAIAGMALQILFRANARWNARWSWYCTEAVAEQWRVASEVLGWGARFNVWGAEDSLPTPGTTEKRWREHTLQLVVPGVDVPDYGAAEFAAYWGNSAPRGGGGQNGVARA